MDFTIVQMWTQMGVIAKAVIVILGLFSVVTLAISVERLLTYAKASRQSREFAVVIRDYLAQKKYQEAADAADKFQGSHIARVIQAGLLEFIQARKMNGKATYDVYGAIQKAIERVTARQIASLRKGLSALATIGSTAPFVGLFGTTFGIINSFQGMAKDGGGGLGAVAAGIAEALVTTAVGIGVAIVAVLIFNYFTSRIESLEVDTHESAGEVVALLAKEQSSSN